MNRLLMTALMVIMTLMVSDLSGQKYFTKEGKISFYSNAPVEKIEAHNYKATGVLDMENGRIQWAVLIKAFNFKKALMQEHFNENYMESSKFPKSSFKGSISDWDKLDTDSYEEVEVMVEGELEIHGEKKNVKIPAFVKFGEEGHSVRSVFKVAVEDYKIQIPNVVKDNIAKEVEVHVEANLSPLDNKS